MDEEKTEDSGQVSGIEEMKAALDALQNVPPERAISAMPVIVVYTAMVGRVEHYKRGEEHYFRITRTVRDGSPNERWEPTRLNAHAVRDRFLNITDWSAAYDFLCATGEFSHLSDRVTWSEFKRWQDFARLALERKQLISGMQAGAYSGEIGEALKALSGDYPSSFFGAPDDSISSKENEWLERQMQRTPELRSDFEEGKQQQEQKRRELWTWFRRPSAAACSIDWFPKNNEDADTILPKLQRGGAMMEFLLPREALRPALVIHPSNTLQAIAAAIYADFANGVEYRTCEFCGRLFALGKQKRKRFCNQSKCKNAAHSARVRSAIRDRKMKVAAKGKVSGPMQSSKAKKGGKK
jgi:hypothetical protein